VRSSVAPKYASTSVMAVLAESASLRLAPARKKKSIRWTGDTVDNENMGKKSSKSALLPTLNVPTHQFRVQV
jgi:hypothetical protein